MTLGELVFTFKSFILSLAYSIASDARLATDSILGFFVNIWGLNFLDITLYQYFIFFTYVTFSIWIQIIVEMSIDSVSKLWTLIIGVCLSIYLLWISSKYVLGIILIGFGFWLLKPTKFYLNTPSAAHFKIMLLVYQLCSSLIIFIFICNIHFNVHFLHYQ